jgi:hypothetical protein
MFFFARETTMRPLICGLLFASSALVLPAGSVQAITCFVVYDRNDNISYQGTYPPVDLSDQGAAEREAMRRRGEHMINMEADRCPPIVFFTGSSGSSALRVDEVVAGMRVPSTHGTSPVSALAAPGARGSASAPGAKSASPAAQPRPKGY